MHNYAQRIFHDKEMAEVLRKTRIELISEKNLQKLGTLYTYEDYRQFYDSCFVPLDIAGELPEGFAPEDDAADDAHYEETLPDASLYKKPAEGQAEGRGEEEEGKTAEGMPDDEDAGTFPRNGEEEFYEEDENRAAKTETFYIEDDDAKSGTPKKSADDEEIVADDNTAPTKASKKEADNEEIVIEDTPANAKAQQKKSATNNDVDEEIVIEDTP